MLCLCALHRYLFRCISVGRCSPQYSSQDEGLISALLLPLSRQTNPCRWLRMAENSTSITFLSKLIFFLWVSTDLCEETNFFIPLLYHNKQTLHLINRWPQCNPVIPNFFSSFEYAVHLCIKGMKQFRLQTSSRQAVNLLAKEAERVKDASRESYRRQDV